MSSQAIFCAECHGVSFSDAGLAYRVCRNRTSTGPWPGHAHDQTIRTPRPRPGRLSAEARRLCDPAARGAAAGDLQAEPGPELQLPGGGIDPGESPLRALHREVRGDRLAHRRPARLGAFRRFTFMPEYDIWAEKLCLIYVARPVRALGPPSSRAPGRLDHGRAARCATGQCGRPALCQPGSSQGVNSSRTAEMSSSKSRSAAKSDSFQSSDSRKAMPPVWRRSRMPPQPAPRRAGRHRARAFGDPVGMDQQAVAGPHLPRIAGIPPRRSGPPAGRPNRRNSTGRRRAAAPGADGRPARAHAPVARSASASRKVK